MCGIIAYVGKQQVMPLLIDGLKKLEYRGYDSAGIALIENNSIFIEKEVGKVSILEEKLKGKVSNSNIGIAHTRWATHGGVTVTNAHPHLDCKKQIAVVHNGIIENYAALKKYLEERGHVFTTQTDTEVIAHLIEEYYDGDFLEAVRIALGYVEGTYGIAVLHLDNPNEIVAARKSSPLILGIGNDGNYITSDISAILKHTNKVIYIDDNELVLVRKDDYEIINFSKIAIKKNIEKISWTLDMIEKNNYKHFMLKEIFEQPDVLLNAMRGRINLEEGDARLDGLDRHRSFLHKVKRIIITACGTSWHAGLIGEYLIEEFANIPVEVDYASEFRYRNPVITPETVVFVISQSGETADTRAALHEAKKKGALVLGICNVVGSSIARETDAGVYLHAGPEIGVASTKAFTSQVLVLNMIALLLGRMRNISITNGKKIAQAILNVPEYVKKTLENTNEEVKKIANLYKDARNFLYLGRGINFPVALEGALKLKEISYIHAEGYPAAEMKHGPIALIDENMPVVFIAPKDDIYDKVISNIQEVKARKGKIIAIATEGDEEIKNLADHVIYIPQIEQFLQPLITVIPLQLLAYYIADAKGLDIDKPRNLAKSVTVE